MSYLDIQRWISNQITSSRTVSREALLTITSVSGVTFALLRLGVTSCPRSTGGNEQAGGVVTITLSVGGFAAVAVAFVVNIRLFSPDTLLQC